METGSLNSELLLFSVILPRSRHQLPGELSLPRFGWTAGIPASLTYIHFYILLLPSPSYLLAESFLKPAGHVQTFTVSLSLSQWGPQSACQLSGTHPAPSSVHYLIHFPPAPCDSLSSEPAPLSSLHFPLQSSGYIKCKLDIPEPHTLDPEYQLQLDPCS